MSIHLDDLWSSHGKPTRPRRPDLHLPLPGALAGHGRRRCGAALGACDKTVTDLSALARAQAEALLAETRGKICARLFRTADGRVVTADEPAGSVPVATCGSFSQLKLQPCRRALWRRLSSGAAAAAVVLQPGSCESGSSDGDVEVFPLMGVTALVPMMGEPAWEPDLQPVMGRIAAPLEGVPHQPVVATQQAPVFEELGDIAWEGDE